jgi:molybdopterin synthase catalytic subunit
MSTRTVIAEVSEHPLDLAAHVAAVADPRAGATASFLGVVRDEDGGRLVTRLEYHAHPTASSVIAAVAGEFASLPDVIGVAVSHRVGMLDVGDVALVAAVSTGHRAEAFDLCRRLVDEVKHRLPVWKRQEFADGTDEWVNCP